MFFLSNLFFKNCFILVTMYKLNTCYKHLFVLNIFKHIYVFVFLATIYNNVVNLISW